MKFFRPWHRRSILPAIMMCMVGAASHAADIKLRKNIDDLTPAELAAFEHAVNTLKKTATANVYDRKGWLWQAWVHNCSAIEVGANRENAITDADLKRILANPNVDSCSTRNFVKPKSPSHQESPGECEHQKNIFLQWHRAELYFFEKALQAADPEGKTGPSTKDVGLPYWNFTKTPSGKRYPKAFENPNSPLWDATRDTTALPEPAPYTTPELMAATLALPTWPEFGGDEFGSNGGGRLETVIHNPMHSRYIRGNMGDNVTAGLDPIFYVFHNFIDFALEKWLKSHGTDQLTGSSAEGFLRAQQDASLPTPPDWSPGSSSANPAWGAYHPNMGQAKLYFNTDKVGYRFIEGPGGEFLTPGAFDEAMRAYRSKEYVFGKAPVSLYSALLGKGFYQAGSQSQVQLTAPFTIPGTSPSKVLLQFAPTPGKVLPTFQADVYFLPSDTKINLADAAFRNRWLLHSQVYWALSGGHAGHTPPVFSVDVGKEVASLTASAAGKPWKFVVTMYGSKLNQPVAADMFGTPTVEAILAESVSAPASKQP